jgi:hypothetical protein
MKKLSLFRLSASVLTLTLLGLASMAAAQEQAFDPSRAKYITLPPHSYFTLPDSNDPAVIPLPQWTFNWKSSFDNEQFSSVIVGTDPSKTNVTTNIKWGIIPIKMVYGASNGNMTFDPLSKYSGNLNTVQMLTGSILFQSLVDYNQGGTDLGKTQYEDAYQRGNFWGSIQKNTDYHLLFPKAVIGPEQTLNVPASEGTTAVNPFGIAGGATVGLANFNWFDEQLQTIMLKFKQIQPDTLPIFVTYNVYLSDNSSESGCCIGGYHSALAGPPNGQTYSYTTVIAQNSSEPVFAQDVGALSHELGEWIMDPFIGNPSPCPSNGILEVGDPLEHDPTFGDFLYTVNGFTYHPQDLVFITWFGAPAATSLGKWQGKTTDVVTFQDESLAVCQIN